MKHLRNIVLLLLGILSFLSALLVGAVLVLWMNPHWVINEKNLRWALTYAPQVKVSWSHLQIEFQNEGWLAKRMHLHGQNVCVAYEPMLDLCAPEIDLAIFAGLQEWKPRLFQVSKLKVHVTQITYRPSQEATAPAELETSLLPRLRLPSFERLIPRALDFTQVGEITARVDEFRLISEKGPPLIARAQVQKAPSEGQQLNARIDFTASKEQAFAAQGDVELQVTHSQLSAAGQAQFQAKDFTIKAPLKVLWAKELQAQLRPEFRWKGEPFQPEVSLFWSSQEIKLNAGPVASRKLWSGGSLQIPQLSVISSLDQELGTPERTQISTSVILKPRRKIPGITTVELSAGASLFTKIRRHSSGEDLTLQGQAHVQGDHSLLQVQGSTQGDLTVSNIDRPILSAAQAVFQFNVDIPRIEVWKDLLESTPFAIPAPLYVLRGTVSASAEAKLPSLGSPVEGQVLLKTDLASKTQKIKTEVTAFLSSQGPLRDLQVVNVDVEALLKKVELELPPLRLQAPPQFLPDKRFVLTEKNLTPPAKDTEKKLPFELNWKARIRSQDPIQLRSNLLKQVVPVSLDLEVKKPSEMSGTVTVNSFPVELFKKKARIDHVNVIFHPGSRNPELDGLILYSNPEVDIRILLLGNAEKPRVEFESDPPLNRQQIVSVLLFNKSLDELNEEEVDSATSLNHAMSDGAFGLFSLIFLSSTPIQSVSYDPTTGAYTARMRLDDRTTFSMGSNFSESRNFTLRRRLGGAWSIRSELKQQDNEPDVVLTLIEWLKRF